MVQVSCYLQLITVTCIAETERVVSSELMPAAFTTICDGHALKGSYLVGGLDPLKP